MFPRAGMSTVTSSVLSLFDATLGQHDYEADMPEGPNNPAFYVGLVIQVVFLIFTMVILFNLLIAKMSTTYEHRQESANRDWEFSRATLMKQPKI